MRGLKLDIRKIEPLTRKELTRRRHLAVKELLHSYRVEYQKALEELGQKGHDWVKTPAALTEFQKGVVSAKFDDAIKKSCEVQPVDATEREEMEELGVPLLKGLRVVLHDGGIRFSEAEAFLSQQLSMTFDASRLDPHPSTSHQEQTPRPKKTAGPLYSKNKTEKQQEWSRLEAFAGAACFRKMDRDDVLFRLLGHHGQFSICQSSFAIGCKASPTKDDKNPATPLSTLELPVNDKKRKSGALNSDPVGAEIDVDLSVEGHHSSLSHVLARVWLKSNGICCIKCASQDALYLDGNPVMQGEARELHHCSLIEIEGIPLMMLINKNATERVRTRSKQDINI